MHLMHDTVPELPLTRSGRWIVLPWRRPCVGSGNAVKTNSHGIRGSCALHHPCAGHQCALSCLACRQSAIGDAIDISWSRQRYTGKWTSGAWDRVIFLAKCLRGACLLVSTQCDVTAPIWSGWEWRSGALVSVTFSEMRINSAVAHTLSARAC